MEVSRSPLMDSAINRIGARTSSVLRCNRARMLLVSDSIPLSALASVKHWSSPVWSNECPQELEAISILGVRVRRTGGRLRWPSLVTVIRRC